MTPTTLANTQSDVTNAYNNGQQLQNMYNSQAGGLANNYNTAASNAQGAQNQLQTFSNNLPNYGNLYGQDLTSAQNMYGFNPADLAMANKNLLNTQIALNYAPQSAQNAGNYYGTTAGQTGAAYQNMAGNLNTTLSNQQGAVNQYQNLLAATQNQANQQTTQQLAGQGQQLQGLTAGAQNATAIMQNAQTAMNNIENLAQQQGYVTSEQVANYNNAYSSYLSAQASASQASSQANLNTQQYQNTNALQQQLKSIYGPNWSQAIQYITQGQPIPSNLSSSNGDTSNPLAIGAGGLQSGGVSGSGGLQ